jgi:hypothetical protein
VAFLLPAVAAGAVAFAGGRGGGSLVCLLHITMQEEGEEVLRSQDVRLRDRIGCS